MKKLIIALTLLSTLFCNAQDIIVTKNGQVFEADIIDSNLEFISFKLYNNLTGPLYKYELCLLSKINGNVINKDELNKYKNPDPINSIYVPVTLRKQTNVDLDMKRLHRSAALDGFQSLYRQYTTLNHTEQGKLIESVFRKVTASAESYLTDFGFSNYIDDFEWEIAYFGCAKGDDSLHTNSYNCPYHSEYPDKIVSAYHSFLSNASSFGYGKIMLGYDFCQNMSENELATVISHEVGHAIANHGYEDYVNRLKTNKNVLVTSLLYGLSEGDFYGTFSGMKLFFDLGITKPNDRKQENEADKIGAVLLALSGYNETDARDFWAARVDLSASDYFNFASTHPNNLERCKNIATFINSNEFSYHCISRPIVPSIINEENETSLSSDILTLNDGNEIACKIILVTPFYIQVEIDNSKRIFHRTLIQKIEYQNGGIENLIGKKRGLIDDPYLGRKTISSCNDDENCNGTYNTLVFYGIDFSKFKLSQQSKYVDNQTLVASYFELVNKRIASEEKFNTIETINGSKFYTNLNLLDARNKNVDYSTLVSEEKDLDAQDRIYTYNPTINAGQGLVIFLDYWNSKSNTFVISYILFDINSMEILNEKKVTIKDNTNRWTDACVNAVNKGWKEVKKERK